LQLKIKLGEKLLTQAKNYFGLSTFMPRRIRGRLRRKEGFKLFPPSIRAMRVFFISSAIASPLSAPNLIW
jgi:hypothetical protein